LPLQLGTQLLHWPFSPQVASPGQVPHEPPQPFEPHCRPLQLGVQAMHWPEVVQAMPEPQEPHWPPQPSSPHCLPAQLGVHRTQVPARHMPPVAVQSLHVSPPTPQASRAVPSRHTPWQQPPQLRSVQVGS
jgi:hypothetical protein